MENFKIGDRIRFKNYVKLHYNSEYYKSFNLDLFDEHIIDGIKGSIIEIKGRKVHNSFVKKVNMNKFKIGDKFIVVSEYWRSEYPNSYIVSEIKGDMIYVDDKSYKSPNGIHYSHLKLIENMEKERVIKAANTSKEAYDLLKELYPDYFEDEKYFDLSKERLTDWVGKLNIGNFAYKSFYLSDKCNWEVSQDEQGRSILIPTKK